MPVDPANARELAQIAGEIGADVLSSVLRYPSETGGGWWATLTSVSTLTATAINRSS